MCEKGWKYHEKVCQEFAFVHPVRRFWALPYQRSGGFVQREMMEMESFANLISMMDFVLDSKRKRHITGGFLLSAALLFGVLAMTVMSIRDEDYDETEDT